MTAPVNPTHAPQAPRITQPSAAFMVQHPARVIALGFGSGLSPLGPGTVGSLWGWVSWLLIQYHFSIAVQASFIVLGLLLGWWACTKTSQHMGVSDPGAVVWDEIVAIWLVLFFIAPSGWGEQVFAVILFRFFDVVKPGPVAWADRSFKGFGWRGGFGIMFDDVLAAFCTLLVFSFWRLV